MLELEQALYNNLLVIVQEYMGKPKYMRNFFDQHIIRRSKRHTKDDKKNVRKIK